MGIIALILGLVTPTLRTNALDQGISGIAGALEQARAYAMANNTYVYVGIAEVDASNAASASSQTAGIGRVALAAVAMRDGTRGYDVNSPDTDWTSGYNNGARLTAISNLQRFENLHITNTLDSKVQSASGPQPATVGTGQMARLNINYYYRLGNSQCVSITPFDWPLGNGIDGGQYHFKKVIQFDPQGIARMARNSDPENIVISMEVALQPTHGSTAPPVPEDSKLGNHAALQLDTMSGAVRIFRP